MLRLAMAAALCAACLYAQSSSSSITGLVTDSSQAALPNVSLRLTNVDTGVVYTATTNNTGEYTLPLLPVGKYSLTAEVGGFQTYVRRDIVVETDRTLRLDIGMQVGQVSERVEVTGTPPMLES